MPSDLNAVLCAILFVLPGYIGLAVANIITPHHTKGALTNLFNCMATSLLLSFFLCDEIASFANSLSSKSVVAADWQTCAGKAFIYAVVFGVGLGLIRRWSWLRKTCELFRINVNTSPTAWDFKFLSIDETKYLEVYLSDGRVVHGKFSRGSNASSIGDEGDGLYLEEAYEGESWEPKYKSDGMYIAADAIQTIEFFDSTTDADDQENSNGQ